MDLYISRYFLKNKILKMKKLKMIITSVVVLAIVGSAFAFKAKTSRFCITAANAPDNKCTTFTLANLKITTSTGPGSTAYKVYQCYDGDQTACTASTNTLCTATLRLTVD
jgi:hypothetical protein